MTDIVERLRQERPQFYESLMREAADEIERLRHRNDQWYSAAKKFLADQSGAELHALIVSHPTAK